MPWSPRSVLLEDTGPPRLTQDRDVRSEHDYDVPFISNVAREGLETGLPSEGCPADAAHGEDLTPIVLHQHRQVRRLVVDLVWAHRGSEDRVVSIETEPFQDLD
eukprot:CAMPEP_0115426844 /NCGR_PEP_ID=MMETSP0271-20121206/29127_1 /TAXON_ID=71861 /ORGANISM="Scrippsiella trochoidea, Strain CCMP3099" /LENGTH=103 /DNA_ID=CAMNT_0002851831 /DNA_START=627 /DNA_END=939 /DNA_ORIENTATION=-